MSNQIQQYFISVLLTDHSAPHGIQTPSTVTLFFSAQAIDNNDNNTLYLYRTCHTQNAAQTA